MNKNKFINWLEKMGEAWIERDPQKAANLFSKDVEYYESVFDSPCGSWNEVLNLWKVVPINQNQVTFNFEIIALAKDFAVANFKVTRVILPTNKKQAIDGIFIIKLNNEGLCNYFKQWRSVKDL
jgi:hypothetical protein